MLAETAQWDWVHQAIRRAFAQSLEIAEDAIDGDDNFFVLGGDSLGVLSVLALIEEEASVALSLQEFFEMPTVNGAAVAVSERIASERSVTTPELSRSRPAQ